MKQLVQKIADIVKEDFQVDVEVVLTRPEPQFGDFSTNVAMQLAKQLGKNPREIAAIICKKLETQASELVDQVGVEGPGFINIVLKQEVLEKFVRSVLDNDLEKLINQTRSGQSIVIETNNPNPFKAMHIGHAFNAILADTIANLLEVSGAKIYRVSYHGDVGLHVGKSMYSLLKYIDGDIEKLNAISEDERNSFMSRMYAEGSKAYDEDETARAEIQDLAEQSFKPKSALYAQVYEKCKNWSFEQIDELVAKLGNKPTERRFLESDADSRGVDIVKKNTPNIFNESDGALVFPGSKYGAFDNVFVGSNGRGLYAARDLGLIQLKNEQYHPQKSYIVTAEEQKAYFVGVLAAAELCFPDQKGVTVNIPHGTVKLSTGKMSSRDGDVVEVSWLLQQVSQAVAEKGGAPNQQLEIGALRYQFLKVRIGSDVVFDVNESVNLVGNTGPYLQYAHARACSILSKKSTTGMYDSKYNKSERLLVSKMTAYPEVVEHATTELAPHLIANYLYDLSQQFNRFYEENQVIGSDFEVERLGLVSCYVGVLRHGLSLLGIPQPKSM